MFVNARFLTQPITGVQRYALELSKELKKLRPELCFIAPRNVVHHELAELLGAEIRGRLTGHAWEQFELPRYARGGLLLSLSNTAPLTKREQLVVLHDASMFAVPDTYSFAFRNWYRLLFTQLSRSALEVITVSRFSQQELAHYCGVPAGRFTVIYEGAQHIRAMPAEPGILERQGLRCKPYLLVVGSRSPHKNFKRLVEALVQLGETPFDVVVAGGTNAKVFTKAEVLPGSVKHVGYVSDAELRALYEHADGFVHPSYYEGFGLPPLEAMACGCPVVVSNAASMPEVCGDAALYFDAHDSADLANKVQQLMRDEALRQRLRQSGRERAEHFTWRKCAEEVSERIDACAAKTRRESRR